MQGRGTNRKKPSGTLPPHRPLSDFPGILATQVSSHISVYLSDFSGVKIFFFYLLTHGRKVLRDCKGQICVLFNILAPASIHALALSSNRFKMRRARRGRTDAVWFHLYGTDVSDS